MLLWVKTESERQTVDRVFIRKAANPALDVADGPRTEAGLVCQLFLR
jgi:hypothetical protein